VRQSNFEWDESKNSENQKKHMLSFDEAQYAFFDPDRVIAFDVGHSHDEKRFYCFGRLESGIVTVRFTYRGAKIRIIGAGYWRKGRDVYEKENKV
jgi:uncharacterized protein